MVESHLLMFLGYLWKAMLAANTLELFEPRHMGLKEAPGTKGSQPMEVLASKVP